MLRSLIIPENIPLSLYIHLPWCIRKCPYCDFNSHALRQQSLPEEEYIDALLRDLHQDSIHVNGRVVSSIFFGGGTPSLFSGTGIARILTAVRNELACDPEMEVTLEANPGAVEHDRFECYRAAGVNRLSMGIQSFNTKHLQRLGRIHNSEDALRAIATAKQAGFDNFNLDLMYGLPEQTLEEAVADLMQACQLNPTHISWYQLTLEPNTVFYREKPILPEEEILWAMQEAGRAVLGEFHYKQYEISAYARANQQCRHNLNYWQFGDYLGIGAGAHGKISLPDGRIIRTAKTRQPKDYLARSDSFLSEYTPIAESALPFEYMLNALRLMKPISFDSFEEHTGLNRSVLQDGLIQARKKGLIEYNEHSAWLSSLGRRFADDVVQLFLVD